MPTSEKVKQETKDWLNQQRKEQEVYGIIALRIIRELEEENEKLKSQFKDYSAEVSDYMERIKKQNLI